MVATTKTKTKKPPAKPKTKGKAKAKAPAKAKGRGKPKAPRKPKAVGRPSKIEQPVEVFVTEGKKVEKKIVTVGEAVVMALEHGCTLEKAAETTGVHRTTIHDWLARAEEWRPAVEEGKTIPAAEAKYLDFLYATTRARARAVEDALRTILEAGKGDWRAAAWFLERSFPDDYGRRTRLDHGGVGGDGETMSLAELFARAASDPPTEDD